MEASLSPSRKGLRKFTDATFHRKVAGRFSQLPIPGDRKMKHLKLDSSLRLLLNVTVGSRQLELKRRIT